MPTRIPVIYPRYPRLYPRAGSRAAAAQASRGGGGTRGGATQPGGIDQSSTGNVGGDIVKAINNQMKVNQENLSANQQLNTQTPPRAQWMGGPAPAQGISTGGTMPQTGGFAELQARQQQDVQDLNDQLAKAKIAAQLALVQQRTGRGGGASVAGGNAAAWQRYLGGDQQQPGGTTTTRGGKAAKAPAYDVGGDANTNLDADKFPNVQADFNAKYGGSGEKGMYAKIMSNLANSEVDPQTGNYTIKDSSGKAITTMPKAEGDYWLSRINAANVNSGQPTLPTHIQGANPNSGSDPGTPTNPYVPKTQLEARSLPYGKYMVDPNSGQIGQKLPPTQEGATTQPATPPAGGQKTSAADTSGSDQFADQGGLDFSGQPGQVASAQPASLPPTPQMPQIVPPVGQFGASRPDMNTGVGADQTAGAAPQDTGGQSLADAIAKARIVQQFRGMA